MFEPIVNSNFIFNILVHIGLLTATCLCFILYLTSKDSRIAKYLNALKGPRGLPIVGNALSFAKPRDQLIPVFMVWAKQYEYCAGFWIANIPYVCIAKPDYVEKILSSNVHINKGKDYESFLETWLGTGLLTARREKWHQRRKLLTPTFHFKILEDFIPIFNEQAKLLNVLLERQRQKQDSFDICPFILRCTLDVICETAMGEKINAQIGGDSDYVRNVCGIADIVIIKALNPLYRSQYIWKMTSLGKMEEKYLNDLHGFTDRVIRDRKVQRKRSAIIEETRSSATRSSATATEEKNLEGTKKRKAFLDLLLDLQESENALTDSDIREEVDTFMFEGHDTTGTNLEWAILMLACYPEYQNRVHEELDGIFADDPERDITTADLTQLKYLECFIKETLRLYPSVPFFMRRVDEDVALGK